MSWTLHTHKELLPPSLSPPNAHELFLLQINSFFGGKGSPEATGLAAVSLVLPEPSPWAALAQSSEAGDEGTSHQLPYGAKATRGSRCVCMVHTSIHLPCLTLPLEESRKGTEREENTPGSCSGHCSTPTGERCSSSTDFSVSSEQDCSGFPAV